MHSAAASVCPSVCLFVRTITSEQLNVPYVRMMKLGGQMHCTNISPKFECQGQRSRSPGTKTRLALPTPDTPECVQMVCARCKQRAAATDGPFCGFQGGVLGVVRQFYAGGKISACCLVSLNTT